VKLAWTPVVVSKRLKHTPELPCPCSSHSCLFRCTSSSQLASAETWQLWPVSCFLRSRLGLDDEMVRYSSSTSLLEPLAFDAQVVKVSPHTDQQCLHQSQQSMSQMFQTCLSPEHGRFGGLHARSRGLRRCLSRASLVPLGPSTRVLTRLQASSRTRLPLSTLTTTRSLVAGCERSHRSLRLFLLFLFQRVLARPLSCPRIIVLGTVAHFLSSS
jgi:hypothetical protein